MHMSCEDCQTQMIELLYAELGAQEAAKVRAHLAECASCAQAYAELQSTLEFVDRLPLEAPSAKTHDAIMQAAHARVAGGSAMGGAPSGRGLVYAPQLAMAAAAMLVVVAGVYAGFPFAPREAGDFDSAAPPPAAVAVTPEVPEQEAPLPTVSKDSAPSVTREVAVSTARQQAKRRAATATKTKPRVVSAPSAHKAARAKSAVPEAAFEARSPGALSTAGAPSVADRAEASGAPDEAPALAEQDDHATDAALDLLGRARALRDRDDCLSAVRLYERFIATNAKDSRVSAAKLETGMCYQTLGNEERARRWLSEAAKDKTVGARARRELERMDRAATDKR